MAVCGRCLICGHKFDGDNTPDVAVRWYCDDACAANAAGVHPEHAICTKCHNALIDDVGMEQRVVDLLDLVRSRVAP